MPDDSHSTVRLFVCGGRDFRDTDTLSRVLTAVMQKTGIGVIVEVGDRAGLYAAEWAVARGVPVLTIRNRSREKQPRIHLTDRILSEGRPNLAVSFAGGPGTAALMSQMSRAGVKCCAVPAQPAPQLNPVIPAKTN